MSQITTLLCTYRRPRLLARALASLAAQTVPAAEIRVFDNASGDGTAAVVRWFQKRGLPIEYFCQRENLGYQRNFTHAMTQPIATEFCHILNDDDFVLGEFFALSLAAHKRVPGAIFSTAQTAWLNPDGTVEAVPLRHWGDRESFAAGEAAAWMLEYGHPELTAMIYRSSWLRDTGGFDFSNYGAAADVPFHVLAAACSPIAVVPRIGGVYWQHSEQTSQFESDASRTLFKRLFQKLRSDSFINPGAFRATLVAAASRHLYVQRHHPGSRRGIRREWRGALALLELIRLRPDAGAAALAGFGRSLKAVFSRYWQRNVNEIERSHNNAAATEVGAFLAQIQKDFINPCYTELGLAIASKSAE